MKIVIDGKTYVLGWKYTKKKGHPASETECYLGYPGIVEEGREGIVVMAKSRVKYHSCDAPNKEAARKYSLQKLMLDMFPGRDPRALHYKHEIWRAYINRPRPKSKQNEPKQALQEAALS